MKGESELASMVCALLGVNRDIHIANTNVYGWLGFAAGGKLCFAACGIWYWMDGRGNNITPAVRGKFRQSERPHP